MRWSVGQKRAMRTWHVLGAVTVLEAGRGEGLAAVLPAVSHLPAAAAAAASHMSLLETAER